MQITFFGIFIRRRYFKRVLSAVPLKLPRYFKRCAARATQHARNHLIVRRKPLYTDGIRPHQLPVSLSSSDAAMRLASFASPCGALRKRLCAAVVGSLISRSGAVSRWPRACNRSFNISRSSANFAEFCGRAAALLRMLCHGCCCAFARGF